MNGLKEQPGDSEPLAGPGDYFIVHARHEWWRVSTVMARFIEQVLDADPRPRWVVFVDLVGSRVRTKVDDVTHIEQCTAEQRATARAFQRSLRQECKDERTWDDDDD